MLKTRKDSDSHPPPLPGGGLPVCTGPDFKKTKNSTERSFFFDLAVACLDRSSNAALADEIGTAKLCTNCKFCMIFVALIPVIDYNAKIAFKRG